VGDHTQTERLLAGAIAGISTRELTMKDFAMEGDEGKMATAAHLMVQSRAR
jgi:CCR4-NOT transcription complex subunit 1